MFYNARISGIYIVTLDLSSWKCLTWWQDTKSITTAHVSKYSPKIWGMHETFLNSIQKWRNTGLPQSGNFEKSGEMTKVSGKNHQVTLICFLEWVWYFKLLILPKNISNYVFFTIWHIFNSQGILPKCVWEIEEALEKFIFQILRQPCNFCHVLKSIKTISATEALLNRNTAKFDP